MRSPSASAANALAGMTQTAAIRLHNSSRLRRLRVMIQGSAWDRRDETQARIGAQARDDLLSAGMWHGERRHAMFGWPAEHAHLCVPGELHQRGRIDSGSD